MQGGADFCASRADLDGPLEFDPRLMRGEAAPPPLFPPNSLDQRLQPIVELPDGWHTGVRRWSEPAVGVKTHSPGAARRRSRRPAAQGAEASGTAANGGTACTAAGTAGTARVPPARRALPSLPEAGTGRVSYKVALPRGAVFCPQSAPLATNQAVPPWQHLMAPMHGSVPSAFVPQPQGFTR